MTKRLLLLGLWLLLWAPLPGLVAAQQAGDVALVGMNTDNPDAFAFVVLAPLSAGTQLHFTDNGWQAEGTFRGNEGTYTYTVPATGLQAGAVVQVENPAGPAFSTSGDQLLVYSGAENAPTFLYALNVEGNAEWQSTASSSNTSALPSGLVNGSTAVAVDEADNVAYSGPTSGTKEELLAAIGMPSNWTGDNASRLAFASSFTLTGGTGNSAPFFTAVPTDATITAGATYSFTYAASDSDGDPITFSLVQGPAAASLDASTGALSWTPQESDAGQSFTIEVTVTGGQASATTSATLTVESAATNRPPTALEAANGLMVDADAPVRYVPEIQDPDLDVLTYTLVDAPTGATVSSTTGEITWSGSPDPGIYSFTLRASDGEFAASHTLHVGVRGVLFAGMTGQALRDAIEADYAPDQTLGYGPGRDSLYARVEARQGVVSGIYTGFSVTLDPNEDPSTHLFNNGLNAEHTWPQSMGARDEPQRSDMHILYPASASVNSSRGNLPYAEIPDAETLTWYFRDQSQSTPPDTDRDAWSERNDSAFEPREAVKGDVARAMFYFATIWDEAANMPFFEDQAVTLAAWVEADPATGEEARRSGLIQGYQGNINPYVLDGTLAARAFSDIIITDVEDYPAASFVLSPPYPNPTTGTAQFTLQVDRAQWVRVTLYDMLGRQVRVVADRMLAAGQSYALRIEGEGLPAGTYFYRVTGDQHHAVRQLTILR